MNQTPYKSVGIHQIGPDNYCILYGREDMITAHVRFRQKMIKAKGIKKIRGRKNKYVIAKFLAEMGNCVIIATYNVNDGVFTKTKRVI